MKNIAKKLRISLDHSEFISHLPYIKAQIDDIANTSQYFKIGKTGQKIEDRFKNYKPEYDEYKTLFESIESSVIDFAEGYLIDSYIKHPKCKNIELGVPSEEDLMKEDSSKYCVYIVWKVYLNSASEVFIN